MVRGILLLVTLLFFNTSTLYAKGGTELLSARERSDILRSIDDVCGDTWCEGDYNFKFENIRCNKLDKTCDLSFYFIKSNDDNTVETFSTLQTCHFLNISSIKQLRSHRYSLNTHFYDELTECIGVLEHQVQF
jgi:hypothetical protein